MTVKQAKRLDALVRTVERIRKKVRAQGVNVAEPTRDELVDLMLDYYESGYPK